MLADLKFCKQHDVPLDANDGKQVNRYPMK